MGSQECGCPDVGIQIYHVGLGLGRYFSTAIAENNVLFYNPMMLKYI